MYSINYISVVDHKPAYKECFANLHIVTFNLGMSAILNNQIKLMSKTRLSSFAMTSVHSHWLIANPFVLSLYKCDTTRMVGRLLYSTTIYKALLISLYTCTYSYKSYILLTLHPLTYLHSLHLINPPHIPKLPTMISLIPHIYLHILLLINLHHISTQPTSH